MDIFNYFSQDCIAVNQKVPDKQSLLSEVAKSAKKNPVLNGISEEDVLQALKDREEIGSTGFENGIAIPHCRLSGISEFVMGCITVPDGVNFGAYDGKNSKIFFYIIAPEEKRDEHIRILSTISRTLATKNAREEILSSGSSEDLREHFLRHISDKLETTGKEEKSLFQITVQLEDKFIDILQTVSALTNSISVIDAEDVAQNLHQLPLFSTFWNSEAKGFHRIICGVIDKRLANEMVRGIHVITDGLEDKSGVLVVLQDVSYCAGALKS